MRRLWGLSSEAGIRFSACCQSKIDYQMHCRMEQMKCICESRDDAKKEYKEMMGKNPSNRTMGIHSYLSYDALKQTSIEFTRYLKVKDKSIKEVSQIKKEHVEDEEKLICTILVITTSCTLTRTYVQCSVVLEVNSDENNGESGSGNM